MVRDRRSGGMQHGKIDRMPYSKAGGILHGRIDGMPHGKTDSVQDHAADDEDHDAEPAGCHMVKPMICRMVNTRIPRKKSAGGQQIEKEAGDGSWRP